ncbi:hypothetical protein CEUSTIGMA_g6990.t1 [Chlamydomonas eustigma]|uniref:Uncharacterized protein n=1 Tax=Chlamydomonas eustigma TaxID=1157962 RepID=A0A250X9I0_9CHLO|nr:hypothetical protein CEUSTIGMA_g6990.t1 [Chlamydomonas eustigma]|eukprot:GAX79549.1 hypothetical protein CEUSTIGMA_g6990.t1 [Chlamydomonas eustigma]
MTDANVVERDAGLLQSIVLNSNEADCIKSSQGLQPTSAPYLAHANKPELPTDIGTACSEHYTKINCSTSKFAALSSTIVVKSLAQRWPPVTTLPQTSDAHAPLNKAAPPAQPLVHPDRDEDGLSPRRCRRSRNVSLRSVKCEVAGYIQNDPCPSAHSNAFPGACVASCIAHTDLNACAVERPITVSDASPMAPATTTAAASSVDTASTEGADASPMAPATTTAAASSVDTASTEGADASPMAPTTTTAAASSVDTASTEGADASPMAPTTTTAAASSVDTASTEGADASPMAPTTTTAAASSVDTASTEGADASPMAPTTATAAASSVDTASTEGADFILLEPVAADPVISNAVFEPSPVASPSTGPVVSINGKPLCKLRVASTAVRPSATASAVCEQQDMRKARMHVWVNLPASVVGYRVGLCLGYDPVSLSVYTQSSNQLHNNSLMPSQFSHSGQPHMPHSDAFCSPHTHSSALQHASHGLALPIMNPPPTSQHGQASTQDQQCTQHLKEDVRMSMMSDSACQVAQRNVGIGENKADGDDSSLPQVDGDDSSLPQADGDDSSLPQVDGDDSSHSPQPCYTISGDRNASNSYTLIGYDQYNRPDDVTLAACSLDVVLGSDLGGLEDEEVRIEEEVLLHQKQQLCWYPSSAHACSACSAWSHMAPIQGTRPKRKGTTSALQKAIQHYRRASQPPAASSYFSFRSVVSAPATAILTIMKNHVLRAKKWNAKSSSCNSSSSKRRSSCDAVVGRDSMSHEAWASISKAEMMGNGGAVAEGREQYSIIAYNAAATALVSHPVPTPPTALVSHPVPTPPTALVSHPVPTPPTALVSHPVPTPPTALVSHPVPTPPTALVSHPVPTPPIASLSDAESSTTSLRVLPQGLHAINANQPSGAHAINANQPSGAHAINANQPSGAHAINANQPASAARTMFAASETGSISIKVTTSYSRAAAALNAKEPKVPNGHLSRPLPVSKHGDLTHPAASHRKCDIKVLTSTWILPANTSGSSSLDTRTETLGMERPSMEVPLTAKASDKYAAAPAEASFSSLLRDLDHTPGAYVQQLTPVDALRSIFKAVVGMAAVLKHDVDVITLNAAAAKLACQYPPLVSRLFKKSLLKTPKSHQLETVAIMAAISASESCLSNPTANALMTNTSRNDGKYWWQDYVLDSSAAAAIGMPAFELALPLTLPQVINMVGRRSGHCMQSSCQQSLPCYLQVGAASLQL